MVRITEHLIRKRAEHNNLEISTLEEVSLHQQDIERIEHIQKWCRELKILYLQSNLIPKIENVGRLKKLEYLNLALNNIEKIENLEGCESLRKLDLTVNFVGELTGIEILKDLHDFRELFLTGNPCTQYEGYRQYVIATLRQLKFLDGTEIEKSERIQAIQAYDELRPQILKQQEQYRIKREREKEEAKLKEERKKNKKPGFDGRWYTDVNKESDGDGDKEDESKDEDEDSEEAKKERERKEQEYWEEKVAFTPESRLEVHEHMKNMKEKENKETQGPDPPKRERRLVGDDGRFLNVNEAKVDFSLTEDDKNMVLDVAVYRHLDTSLCDVDVQTDHVKVTLKGKVLQLALTEEVKPDSSTAKRSTTTGHLVITMPKLNPTLRLSAEVETALAQKDKKQDKENTENGRGIRHERLEVDPSKAKTVNLEGIVKDKSKPVAAPLGSSNVNRTAEERQNSDDFVDDPDVPPLD